MAITRRSRPPFKLTNSVTIEIERGVNGELIKGRWEKGEPYHIFIEANIQPLQYKDIMQMTEADRTKEWIKIYSAEELRTAKEGYKGHEADTVFWEGEEYKVMRCRHYSMGILDHWQALAARTPISAGPL